MADPSRDSGSNHSGGKDHSNEDLVDGCGNCGDQWYCDHQTPTEEEEEVPGGPVDEAWLLDALDETIWHFAERVVVRESTANEQNQTEVEEIEPASGKFPVEDLEEELLQLMEEAADAEEQKDEERR